MAFMQSQTRIANRTLILLGSVERLQSINDPGPVAEAIRDIWDESRRTGLAEHPWNFAVTRAVLNRSADAPAFGYRYKYALPADCLRWLPWSQDAEDYFSGEEEGGFLLTDAATCRIRYIFDQVDVGKWSPHFVDFMAYQLAADLAEGVTQIQTNGDDMRAKRDEALLAAKEKDALASGNRSRGNVEIGSRWVNARREPTRNVPGSY